MTRSAAPHDVADSRRLLACWRAGLALLCLAPACVSLDEPAPGSAPPPFTCPPAVTGPFTGPVHRFVLRGLTLPQSSKEFSGDLDGDWRRDNGLALVCNLLASFENLAEPAAEAAMIAAGTVTALLELQTDDPALRDDPTVAVRLRAGLDDPGVVVLGALAGGTFASTPTPCLRRPLAGTLLLPLLVDADPIRAPVVGTSVSFVLDGGPEALRAEVHAAVPAGEIFPSVWPAFDQMMRARPWQHHLLLDRGDRDGDGSLSRGEFEQIDVIAALLAPDVRLFSGGMFEPRGRCGSGDCDSLSLGLELTFGRCADGLCLDPKAAPSCLDRARNGDESDVDCGGSCHPCGGSAQCRTAADCESASCQAGRCAPPSCKDGVKNQWESDVDCGDTAMPASPARFACPPCDRDRRCLAATDCRSGQCQGGLCQ